MKGKVSLMTLVVTILVWIAAVVAALLCLAGLYGFVCSLVCERKILRENRCSDGTVELNPKQRRRWLNRRYATMWAVMMVVAWGNLAFVLSTWLFDMGLAGWARGYATMFAVGILVAFLSLGGRHNKLVYVLCDPKDGMRTVARRQLHPGTLRQIDADGSMPYHLGAPRVDDDYRRDD